MCMCVCVCGVVRRVYVYVLCVVCCVLCVVYVYVSQPHPVCMYLNLTLYVCVTRLGLKRLDGRKSALRAAVHQELLASTTNSSPAAATTNSSPAAATTNSSPAAFTNFVWPGTAASDDYGMVASDDSNSEWSFPHKIGDRVEVYWPAEK